MPTELVDGFSSVPLGMNCADDPDDLRDGYLRKLINGTVRGGRVKTRPPFGKLELSFEDPYSESVFKNGRFQGCETYKAINRIVCLIGGAAFLVNPDNGEVRGLYQKVGFMSRNVDRGYFLDAGRFFIIQDGVNRPIIMDQGVARRSDPNKPSPFPSDAPDAPSTPEEENDFPYYIDAGEVPVGTHMAAGNGRIAVALANESDFVVGDIAFPDYPENILFFTETNYIDNGGAFRLPEEFGKITAMGFQSAPDTSIGQGPLVVSGERGMSWYNISAPRSQWRDIEISKAITISAGAASGSAFRNVNSDIVFYGDQEIRTLAQSMRSEKGIISKPISREVSCWLEDNDHQLDHLVYGMYHDDRYFCTVAPEVVELPDDSGQADIQFRGLVVLDFERTNGLEETNRPAYDGLWTGLNFTGLCNFPKSKRAFCFSKDLSRQNEIHEIGNQPSNFDGLGKAIVMKIQPARFAFRDERGTKSFLAPKTFYQTSIWPSEVEGKTIISGEISADSRREWTYSGSATVNAKVISKYALQEPLQNMAPQTRQRITLGGANTSKCDDETGKLAVHGYGFDTCIKVEGVAKIRSVLNHALLATDNIPDGRICDEQEESILPVFAQDDYEYKIEKARDV